MSQRILSWEQNAQEIFNNAFMYIIMNDHARMRVIVPEL